MGRVASVLGIIVVFLGSPPLSIGVERRLPDEMEIVGGVGLAKSNSGVAGGLGLGAVEVNPALMSASRQYLVGGAYYWPVRGREFYHAGVIDSVTSDIAAGFHYTGFTKDFNREFEGKTDSPVHSRSTLAFAAPFSRVIVGGSLSYVEGFVADGFQWQKKKGTSLGLGLAGLIRPGLVFGVAAQNLRNRNIDDFAPRVYRVGLDLSQSFYSLSLEYRERDRIWNLEGESSSGIVAETKRFEPLSEKEKLLVVSTSLRFYDMLDLMVSYGESIKDQSRRTLSGGLRLTNQTTSIAYLLSRPFLDQSSIHQSLQLSLLISI